MGAMYRTMAIHPLLLAIVVALTIFVLWRYVFSPYRISKTVGITTDRLGAPFRVHTSHQQPKMAAEMLDDLHQTGIIFLDHLQKRYVKKKRGSEAQRVAVRNLLDRYNVDNLLENSPKDPFGDTSYLKGKGDMLAMCLRKKDGSYGLHEFPILYFVFLHELAHLAVDVKHHPPEFWQTFKFLLEENERAGIYTSPDFQSYPMRYCGIIIDYNPRWDPTQPSI